MADPSMRPVQNFSRTARHLKLSLEPRDSGEGLASQSHICQPICRSQRLHLVSTLQGCAAQIGTHRASLAFWHHVGSALV
jgi:hypothetical protein